MAEIGRTENNFSLCIDGNLSRKASQGAVWITVAIIFSRGLKIISTIILTRLLLPSDYGIMAIAIVVITLMQNLTRTGFDQALIQKQKKSEEFLNIAWTFELLKNLFLFLILFILAPIFARFFNEPVASAVLKTISFGLIFRGLTNVGIVYFRKHLDFKKQSIFIIIPVIIYVVVVIPLAFILKNVWALVWASLAKEMVVCMISYIMHPYRPILDFNTKKIKKLVNFGKWIFGNSIIAMIRKQGIALLVGKLFGMAILGFYDRAEAFSIILFIQVIEVVWSVAYPVYSQLQVAQKRLKKAYLLTLQLLTFVGLPMVGGFLILSNNFIHLFLTDKWIDIAPVIQVLCVSAIITFITTPAEIMFQAVGKPSINTKILTIGVIILAVFIYPLSLKYGITGTAISYSLSNLITLPIYCYMAIKILKSSVGEIIKPILLALINTGIMMIVIFSIKEYLFVQIGFIQFFILIIIGIIIYLIIAYFYDKLYDYGIYKLIKNRIKVLTVKNKIL